MKRKAQKEKPCETCGYPFTPKRMGQKTCSPKCEFARARTLPPAPRKAPIKKKKLSKEDIRWWHNKAKGLAHAYVRERDKGKPCISCGARGKLQAGHYRPVSTHGAWQYDETNIHGQCAECNILKSGNPGPYRINLRNRIGIEELERLDGKAPIRKWTIEELKEICESYSEKLKELK